MNRTENYAISKKNFCLNTWQIFVLLEISQKSMSGLLAKNQSGEKEEKQIFWNLFGCSIINPEVFLISSNSLNSELIINVWFVKNLFLFRKKGSRRPNFPSSKCLLWISQALQVKSSQDWKRSKRFSLPSKRINIFTNSCCTQLISGQGA